MQSLLGDGTRRAAVRWLTHLRVADVRRARVLFTHHPRYADLTPVQYAEGLAWLRRTGLVTAAGRPVVDISGSELAELSDESFASVIPGVLWSRAAEEARAQIGAAGEQALLRLLRGSGVPSVRHVAEISDAYGYDISAELTATQAIHLEVKSTTDPTRLQVNFTRHECEVMRTDTEWIMAAVLVGAEGKALSVATVRREWLLSVVPGDRSKDGRWQSARLAVPPEALTPGLRLGYGRRLFPDESLHVGLVWGMRRPVGRLSEPARRPRSGGTV
ncbi:protein NO VEIN domain-containing protein [Streptomyces scopuliridis]|uniref:protein NO VEIN domain-containing protein n=1 Tax=Streptomyces scopuliridis TaxID=452529 RepID=UPI0036A41DC6